MITRRFPIYGDFPDFWMRDGKAISKGCEMMFEAGSESNLSTAEKVTSRASTKAKQTKAKVKIKAKPEGFQGIVTQLNNWSPSNPEFSRSILASELKTELEAESHSCINSCVPALIVDSTHALEIMHFRNKDDIDEFVTRMVWMHEVFKSSIGIFMNVPAEHRSLVEEVCHALLKMEDDCVVIIR
jgi:hypothetical protein